MHNVCARWRRPKERISMINLLKGWSNSRTLCFGNGEQRADIFGTTVVLLKEKQQRKEKEQKKKKSSERVPPQPRTDATAFTTTTIPVFVRWHKIGLTNLLPGGCAETKWWWWWFGTSSKNGTIKGRKEKDDGNIDNIPGRKQNCTIFNNAKKSGIYRSWSAWYVCLVLALLVWWYFVVVVVVVVVARQEATLMFLANAIPRFPRILSLVGSKESERWLNLETTTTLTGCPSLHLILFHTSCHP